MRQIIMARTGEATIGPTSGSTAPNRDASRPKFEFQLGDHYGTPAGSGRPENATTPGATGLTNTTNIAENTTPVEPPPVKPTPVKPPLKTTMVSEGVINGTAISLPVPAYPAAAKAVGASGTVDVQVVID